MAGHIYHLKEEKKSKTSVAEGECLLSLEPTDAPRRLRRQPIEKIRNCGQHSEDLPADIDRPLYSSRIINTYIEYLEKFHPDVDIDAVLRDAEMTRHEVEDPGHWFSQHQADSLHRAIVTRTGNPNIAREAGRFTVSSERVGAAKQYALGSISLASIYMKIGRFAQAMSRGAVMTTKKLSSNKVEIVARPLPGTREKPYQCQNRIGTLEGVGKLVTNKFSEIEHPDCIHKGDDCCRYILVWEKTPALVWRRISHYTPISGLMICLMSYPVISAQASIALGLLWAFLSMTFFLRAAHLEKKELVKTIESQGNAARDLLNEINLRHSNALLVQEIGQAVSKILNEDRIADTIVGGIAKHLHFNRGMVLLADDTKTRLQYISGFGYTREQGKFLVDTEFHLDKPDARGHFVRCFREQKPFLIRDVAEIEKDLSPRSLDFVRRMAVQSFICVPIIYEEASLGVLVVENTKSRNHLAQSEISLLMGVASQTATAIMNARSFKKIKESEQQYRLLADNISDVIWIIDLSLSKFTYISPSVERLQGFTPKALMERKLRDILTPRSFEIAKKAIIEELAKEKKRSLDPYRSRTLELEQYHQNGSTIWVEVTASFLYNDAGEVVSILGVSRDITAKRQAEQETKMLEKRLQQAQKMEAIGTLAGGIAHDFNNILTAVIGYTEMARADAQDGTILKNNLREVLTAGHRAKDLVKQILAFSRQADRELKPAQVDLIVKEAVKLLRASLPSTIEIQQKVSSHSATLADSTQIHQVLMNLCTNADHAMRDTGGTLTLELADVVIDSEFEARKLDLNTGAHIRLVVSDTGHGMPLEVQKRIFDPFFTTKEVDKGTGMGLAVVHGIVKSHGGAITVRSEPGRGTTFEVFFPIINSQVKTSVPSGDGLPTGHERILFIDDEKILADLGRQMLERLGYTVTCRTSSIEALELFKTRKDDFALVITDMTMPNLTGEKLAQQLMRIRPGIPVILCTGFSEQINAEKAQKLGISEFILKPLVMDKLARAVRSALDRAVSA